MENLPQQVSKAPTHDVMYTAFHCVSIGKEIIAQFSMGVNVLNVLAWGQSGYGEFFHK